ncbi:MAG TPA: ECF-type sigma factor [Pyrinomonadaceae bacterium]
MTHNDGGAGEPPGPETLAKTLLTGEVTRLLIEWGNGDDGALEELTPLIYKELRRRAGHVLRPGRRDVVMLQATELIGMAFLEIGSVRRIPWKNRAQFIGVVTKMMLHVFIDHVRMLKAEKRGGGLRPEQVGGDAEGGEVDPAARGRLSVEDLADLHAALEKLEERDRRQSTIFGLRDICGYSIGEAADMLEISTATVEREHRKARAYVYSLLRGGRAA